MTPTEWLLSGDTGVSSKTIFLVMTGSFGAIGREWYSHDTPSDPDDFGRCYRLLKHFPEWRERLSEVALHFPKWGPMVAAWDDLTAMYERISEPDGRYTRASYQRNEKEAKAMFARMQKINDKGRIADGWKKDGPNSWSKKQAKEIRL